MFGYFFFAIRVKYCAILSPLCLLQQQNLVLRTSQVPDPSSGHHPLLNCSHFPYFANVFQIWTTLAGYKELAVRFVPIEKGSIF